MFILYYVSPHRCIIFIEINVIDILVGLFFFYYEEETICLTVKRIVPENVTYLCITDVQGIDATIMSLKISRLG